MLPRDQGVCKNALRMGHIRQRFELWTSGKLSDNSIALVNAAQAKHPKLDIQLQDADYVLGQAISSNDQALPKTYRQRFVTHPMQEFEEARKREQRKAYKPKARLKAPSLEAPAPPAVSPLASPAVPLPPPPYHTFNLFATRKDNDRS